jgi:hypothetical protein
MHGMRFRVLLFAALLLGCSQTGGPARAHEVAVEVTGLRAQYQPGESGQVGFFLQLLDPEVSALPGVWFLNIVKPLQDGSVRQVAHLLFSSAHEDPEAFRQVFSAAELQAGVAAGLSFTFRGNAAPGDYDMVLQLFEGDNVNPNTVGAQRRIALQSFRFSVVRE